MLITPIPTREVAKLLRTGQTTSYVNYDDGYYQKGIAKEYLVLSTGQFAGTTIIDLIHYTASTIAFAATTPGTITDSANLLAQFKTNDVIVISGAGAGANVGVYNVSTGNVAGTIRTTEATTLQAAGGSVSIAKRELHSNNCVLDLKTGKMWSRYVSDKMGPASDGKLPWTTHANGYGIYAYALAANAGTGLALYTDWRIPNVAEQFSLHGFQEISSVPPSTVFPSFPADNIWSSSTHRNDTSQAFRNKYSVEKDKVSTLTKSLLLYCHLVRGGNQ